MSLTIIYLVLCLIPESGICFNWLVLIIILMAKFAFELSIRTIVELIKEAKP